MLSRIILSIIVLFAVGTASARDELHYRTFSVINAATGLADNSAQTLNTTRSGRLIITTIGHVNFYDGKSFSHVNSDQKKTYRLKDYEGNYHTYFDQNHHFWLKDKHKVSCVNLHTEQFVSNIADIFKEEGITGNVDDLFTDSERRLWLVNKGRLSGDKGKYSIPISKSAKLQDLGTLGDSLFLFYSDSKIEVYDLKTQRLVRTAKSLDSQRAAKYNKTTVFLFHNDSFFQLRSGYNISVLTWVDTKTLKSKIIMEKDYSLCNLAIYKGLLYIASSYGYWTLNLKTGEIFHREKLEMDNGRQLETDINAIDFDLQGGMWIGTEKRGLLYSKPHSSPFIAYSWETPESQYYWRLLEGIESTAGRDGDGEAINCVTTDSRGWRWVGMMTGIKIYDRNDRLIQHINLDEGMLNEVVHSIVEDNYHNMWAGTSNGIVAINVNNGKIGYVNSYNSLDGVPSESFLNGKAMKLADGSIVMQAVDHVMKFNPAHFHTMGQEKTLLTAKFVKFMVNGINVYAGTKLRGKVILENVAAQTKEVNLDYNQNFINMTFSGLNYFRPYQTYYRYRVVGYDDHWRTASYYDHNGLVDSHGLFHLPLPELEPGNYVAEIQASMYPDQCDGKVTSIKINISQPWWRSSLAYIIVTILIITLLAYNIAYYNTNYKTRLAKQAKEQQIIRQLQTFLQRSEMMAKVLANPTPDQVYMASETNNNDISGEFVKLITKIKPILRHDVSTITAAQLSEKAGLPLEEFYKCVASNINKSPKLLDRYMRMEKACDIMRYNPQLPIVEVASMVNYASANFFIATFYRQYKITPKQYRGKMTAWRQG